MTDKDKIENEPDVIPPVKQEAISPTEQEEEIIFPNKDSKPEPSTKKFRMMFSPLKSLVLVILIAGVYFAGYFTGPENFQATVAQFKEWISASKEKVAPYQEKLTQAIESNVKNEPSTDQGSTSSAEGGGTKTNQSKRKVKYWQSPMNPSYIRDKPGKSPMGMDLIPVYEDESEVAGQIKINPTVVQNIGVKTVKVKRRSLTRKIRTIGTLTYDERKVHHIHTKYEGWIEKLHVNFTGQEVNQDDMLLEVYSPELVSTQEEFLLALKYKDSLKESPFTEIGEAADSLMESTRKRLQLFDVPDHQIEALIRDKKITKTMHIHSPVRGFVIEKKALQGMRVQPGMGLYMIADLSNIWVLADIYEYEVPWIKVGQKVEMNLSYFPGKKFAGKVTFIDPFLDPKTRTNKVRMEFANPKWNLKPDMYANVTIKSTVTKRGVAVPEEAVIHSGERDIVIVQGSSGTFESRELTLGPQAEGYYQVLKGLRTGETVVTSSSFLIDSESKLQEAIGKLQKSTPAPPMNRENMKPPSGKLMLQMDKNNSRKTTNSSGMNK
jgi:membrane fusion protein, copper/silver efflux system